MWSRKEDDLMIDIQPRGEQDRHIVSPECECEPRVGQSDDKRVMVVHRTYDGARGFKMVGHRDPEVFEARRAA